MKKIIVLLSVMFLAISLASPQIYAAEGNTEINSEVGTSVYYYPTSQAIQSIVEPFAVIDPGTANYSLVHTKYYDNKLDKDAYNVALILAPAVTTAANAHPLTKAITAGMAGLIRYFHQPTVYYYTQKTYVAYDSYKVIVKTENYVYTNSSRTKLYGSYWGTQSFYR